MTSQSSLAQSAAYEKRGGAIVISFASMLLLLLWAGFWLWFSVSVVVSERTTAWQPYTFIASVLALTFVACRFPKVGGPLLVAAGLVAAIYFGNPWARGLLSAPAFVLGLMRAWVAYVPRTQPMS